MEKWFCSDCTYGIVLNRLTSVESKYTSLATLVKDMEDVKRENAELRNKVDQLCKQIDNIKLVNDRRDQYNLKNNIIIANIPESKDENLLNIVGNIAKVLGVKAEGILASHRLKGQTVNGPNVAPREIIVKLLRHDVKEKLMESFKKKRNGKLLWSEILGTTNKRGHEKKEKKSKDVNIYLKDHLTPFRSFLLRKAKRYLKEKKLAFAWVKRGSIYARKEEKSAAKHILTESDLDILVKTENAEIQNPEGNEDQSPAKDQ
ncbi:uncharacterized protein LOC106754491, partial [Vigna radiata var. radiata]